MKHTEIKSACVLLENYLDDNIDSLSDDVLQTVLEAARRYAASQHTRGEVPEGWKLVPIEPTEEMRFAAGTLSRWYKDQRTHVEIYKAMLSAAPTAEGE